MLGSGAVFTHITSTGSSPASVYYPAVPLPPHLGQQVFINQTVMDTVEKEFFIIKAHTVPKNPPNYELFQNLLVMQLMQRD
jgi:hypothetical protein